MGVQQRRDAVGVADDPGHVAGCGERADLQRTRMVANELFLQDRGVNVAVHVLGNDDDISDRLPPGQVVGVMLERPDEDHRAFTGGDGVAEMVTVFQCGRDTQPEDADQFVDRTGAARSCEDHDGFGVAADSVEDDGTGVFAQPGRLQTGSAGLSVCVGVAGQYLVADKVPRKLNARPDAV